MMQKHLWLNTRDPVRNGRSCYEFDGDCGRDRYVIEVDRELTTGLSEEGAQVRLRKLRPRIQRAARLRHEAGKAYPERIGTHSERYRIAITEEDLAATPA
jgi:hypothetical protein